MKATHALTTCQAGAKVWTSKIHSRHGEFDMAQNHSAEREEAIEGVHTVTIPRDL